MSYPYRAVDRFKLNFREKILSEPDRDDWNYQRERAIIRDRGKCDRCGMDRHEHKEKYGCDIHVHHIIPRSELPETVNKHRLDNLITVCAACHREMEPELD